MRSSLLVALVLGCLLGGCVRDGIGTRVRTVLETPSHKRLTVYSSPTFATDAREVPLGVVEQALRASSMFFDDDIRVLAPRIRPELARLARDERLVVETSDTAIHVFVGNNEVQIVNFRQGHEMSRHSSAIPAAPIKTELASQPGPPQPVQVTPEPQRPVEVARPAVVVAPPPPVAPVAVGPDPTAKPVVVKPVVVAKPKPRPVVAKPAAPRLTEPEIRARLSELDRLRTKQLITEAEYDQKRKALLDQL